MVFDIEEFQLDDNASKHNAKEIISGKLYTQVEDFRPGSSDVVVDVAALFGYYSVLCAKRHNVKGVYAFEAVPENFKVLLQNRERNSAKQIVPFNHTLGDYNGIVQWHISDSEINNQGVGKLYQAETRLLDEIIMPEVSFLKITAPGYAINVLKGGLGKINADHPKIIVRIDSRDEMLSVFNILKLMGYKLKEEVENINVGRDRYHKIQFYD